MDRRSFLALPVVAAVPRPERSVYDIRIKSERLAYIDYLNARTSKAWPFSEDFLLGIYEKYAGEPTRLSTYGVDVVVPLSFAEEVWQLRRACGIHLVA